MKITWADVRKYSCDERNSRYCWRGCKKFAERHGLDWQTFVDEGVDAKDLVATGDAMALRIVEKVKHG